MQFDRLKEALHQVQAESLRMDCDNMFEAVFTTQEITKVTDRLQDFFGTPVWPSKTRLSFQMQEAIKSYGGIMPGQTLYFFQEGSTLMFAMLWPWQDGSRTTIKVVRKSGEGS